MPLRRGGCIGPRVVAAGPRLHDNIVAETGAGSCGIEKFPVINLECQGRVHRQVRCPPDGEGVARSMVADRIDGDERLTGSGADGDYRNEHQDNDERGGAVSLHTGTIASRNDKSTGFNKKRTGIHSSGV